MGTIILLQKPLDRSDITLEPTTTALWVRFVKAGEYRAHKNLSEELESFLVFTLMRFVKQTDLLSTTLALEYLKASTEYTGKKKEQTLSVVGDTSLILAGLYPERTKRLNVSPVYFSQMGQLAFKDLASILEERQRTSLASLYRNASEGFHAMVKVLVAAKETGGFIS